ncbi:hypothetical protein V7S43_014296 [Phytophthora oleae]|uniref:Crinkler effector protein N-terminal domain-containing protein n=1 Tax=Phytophthora oleae TaxID=2107226 RepID=A0ABD3F152_9STRA
MPFLRMTSSILKATMDSPTALNMVSKSLSANFVASIHPHQQHQPKREQLKDRRVSEPTRCVQLKQTANQSIDVHHFHLNTAPNSPLLFHVDIVEDTSVGELKIAITSALRYTGRPDKLQLYLAKKGSAWLTERDVLEGVSDLNDDNRLKFARATLEVVGLASDQLGKVSDEDAAGGLGPVHVVVEIAEEKSVTRKTRARSENDDQRLAKRLKATEVEKWEWKEEEPVYYRKGRLFFVNREKAVQDLVKFHERKFKRANQGIGDTWVIPLLDNDYGFGKTTFDSEYIRRCQSLERDSTMVRGFMDTLCSCHTIPISLIQMQVLEKNGDFHAEKASRSLIDCIRAFFKVKYVTLPHAFDKPEETYAILLTNLTEEVEPLFIVIDEIGLAFNHNKLDGFARSEQFIKFCKVLQPLFENQKLFFLVAGRASFLNHVARRPLGTGSITTSSPFLFERLDLHLLRHEAIKTIIENTRWEETSTSESIKAHLQLTNNRVMDLSARLFETTFGHPRSLSKAFETCESYDEHFNYVPDVPIKGVEWNSFFEKLWLYRTPLEDLMNHQSNKLKKICQSAGVTTEHRNFVRNYGE